MNPPSFRHRMQLFGPSSKALIVRSATVVLLSCSVLHAFAQQSRETDLRIQFLQSRVSADPDSAIEHNRLGAAYLQKARESGDLAYYDLAEKAVRRSLELESTHEQAASTFSLLSTVEFSKHNFKEAAEDAERALKLDPQDLGAAVSAGDAYAERGEYETARRYYSQVDSARRSQRPSVQYLKLTRQATLALALANPKDAIPALEQAVDAAQKARLPSENVAWTQFTLGEAYLQNGDFGNAETALRASLQTFPGYHRALAGMAQVRVAQRRYKEAISNYQKAIAVIPLPVYVSALGDLYKELGNAKEAEKQYKLVEYIAALSFLSKNVYNRELATFYADHEMHQARAVELARREFEVRHDLYTQDALAWALFNNGQKQEAMEAARALESFRLQDPLMLYHLGMICEGFGEREKSRKYLETALAINPQFHIFYADHARELLGRPMLKAENSKAAQ
ncbi:MAG TPA: tetratricopeptide repeat protein [Terriglobales bacterium]